MSFPRKLADRKWIAAELRRLRPDWNVVRGAAGCAFLSISLGETIKGSSPNSVWSRPVNGSRELWWDAKEFPFPCVLTIDDSVRGRIRMGTIHRASEIIVRGKGWQQAAVESLLATGAQWLIPVERPEINRQLLAGERFETRFLQTT